MYLSLFIWASFFYIGSAEEWSFYEETGFYYQVHRSTEGLYYWDASTHCQSHGAKLASIDSKDENDYIYSISRHVLFTGKNWDEMTLIESWYPQDNREYNNWNDMSLRLVSSEIKSCVVMMTSTQDYWTSENRLDTYFALLMGEWVPVDCAPKFKSVVCKTSTNPEAMTTVTTSTAAIETTTTTEGITETTSQATTVQNSSVEIQNKNSETVQHVASGILIDVKDVQIMGLVLVIILLLCCIICMLVLVLKKGNVIVQFVRNDSIEATLSSEKSNANAPFVSLTETRPKGVKENIQSENGLQKENIFRRTIDDFESPYNAHYYPGFGDNNSFKVVLDDFDNH